MTTATSRQPTPATTVGILSDSGIRLDERLDLIDFLDGNADVDDVENDVPPAASARPSPSSAASAASSWPAHGAKQRLTCGSRPSSGTTGGTSLPAAAVGWGFGRTDRLRRQNSRELMAEYSESPASEVARRAELLAARNILHDEIPSSAPWYLKMLYCFAFPCFGVEPSLKAFAPLMPRTPRLRLEETLVLLDRHAGHGPRP